MPIKNNKLLEGIIFFDHTMLRYANIFIFFRTRTRYGEEKEKFKYSLALVFFQCIINAIYAKISKYKALMFKIYIILLY